MRRHSTWLMASILTVLSATQAFADPVVVSCGSGQHAVVRSTFVRGEPVTQVQCVRGGAQSVAYRAPNQVRYGAERRHRSLTKSAFIIGGSAGTGAGIGGIVKGKKGALIGAALGAGAASLYEGARRPLPEPFPETPRPSWPDGAAGR